MSTITNPRPYRSNEHLRNLITSEAGNVVVQPLRADSIHFDIAWSNYFPTREGQHGSSPLDIGRGVSIRAIGNVVRAADGIWRIQHLNASQEPTGRDLTPKQGDRACVVIGEMIDQWARTHEGDIQQADDIDRNNGARTLEEAIAKHEQALAILRDNLERCNEGQEYSVYPDLPTKR